jgi:hypothetical protein
VVPRDRQLKVQIPHLLTRQDCWVNSKYDSETLQRLQLQQCNTNIRK